MTRSPVPGQPACHPSARLCLDSVCLTADSTGGKPQAAPTRCRSLLPLGPPRVDKHALCLPTDMHRVSTEDIIGRALERGRQVVATLYKVTFLKLLFLHWNCFVIREFTQHLSIGVA